jgi:pimeloyl-ACP methyl ester carboxylesterase
VRVRALIPQARVVRLAGLGHLAHEERPRRIAGLVGRFARSVGVG